MRGHGVPIEEASLGPRLWNNTCVGGGTSQARIEAIFGMALAIAAIMAAPASAANYAYVANQGSNSVSTYSIGAGGSLESVGVTAVGAGPTDLEVSPDGTRLYVANSGAESVSVFSIGPGSALTPVDGSPFPVTGGPVNVALSPDGSRLFVNADHIKSVWVFRVTPDGLVGVSGSPFPTGQEFSDGMAITPDGRHLYIPTIDTTNVAAFDVAADGTLEHTSGSPFDIGGFGSAPAVTPDGAHLYVAAAPTNGPAAAHMRQFSIEANGALTPIPGAPTDAGRVPSATVVAPDGARVYALNGFSGSGPADISVFSIGVTGLLSPLDTTTAGSRTSAGAVDPAGTELYATNPEDGNVQQFTIASDGKLTASGAPVPTLSEPSAIALTPAQGPVAKLSFSGTTAGGATVLDASASGADEGRSIARYEWDFGDGSIAPNGPASPRHAYEPGTYTVTLTVADNFGCSTKQVANGLATLCNGGPPARTSQQLTVNPPLSPIGPPKTKLVATNVNQRHDSAKFRFNSPAQPGADAKPEFQCALTSGGTDPDFMPCESPKRYGNLDPGRYRFRVRAVSTTAKDDSPAQRRFRIRG